MIRIHFAGLVKGRRTVALVDCTLGNHQAESARRFAAASFADADVIVFPHPYYDSTETEAVARVARDAGKPCLFFRDMLDDVTPGSPGYGLLYRASILADRRTPSERAMPAFCDDVVNPNADSFPALRAKQPRPKVGFCGYVGSPLNRLLYRMQGRTEKLKGLQLRRRTIAALKGSTRIDPDFVCRTQFWGGAKSRFKNDPQLSVQVREEFLGNLFNSDYALCLRGAGNYSYRFYEVLSAGRIPLFVNTKCVLPLEDEIDWKRYCIWVEEDDIPKISDIVADFHDTVSPQDFVGMQSAARALWAERLQPIPFFSRILEKAIVEGTNPGA